MHTSNIAKYLSTMAKQQPDNLAIAVQQPDYSFKEFSYNELECLSNNIATGLSSKGIGKNTRTAVMVQPGIEFFAIIFALFKIGAVLVAIDPGLGIKGLKQCLQEAEPEVFIGNFRAHLARILFGWAKQTIHTRIISTGPSVLFPGVISLQKLISSADPDFDPGSINTELNDMAAILFTSGSTGSPKGVVYSHENFLAQVYALKTHFNIQPGEIDLATFPLFALYAPAMGMTSIIPDMDFTRPGSANPEKLFKAIDKYKATTMFGSPALIDKTGRWGTKQKRKLPSLKRVLSAGAPVSATVLERFSNLLENGVQVFTPYGATESLPVASIGSNEVLTKTRTATDAGMGICVGRPVAGMSVYIIPINNEVIPDWKDELLLDTNQKGEIVVQGAQVTKSYFNRPRETQQAKIYGAAGEVYHRMGDTGYIDEAGRLWFCGRKAHCVFYNNTVYYSICCEGVFNVHEKVYRTALIGLQRDGNTVPALCVELETQLQPIDQVGLRDELLELGTQYEHTKVIRDIFFHPGFPVDIRHNAKIDRARLAVWARGQSS